MDRAGDLGWEGQGRPLQPTGDAGLASLPSPWGPQDLSGQEWDWDMGAAFLAQFIELVDLSCHCKRYLTAHVPHVQLPVPPGSVGV